MEKVTQEQLRARHAWRVVEEAQKSDEAKDFAAEVKRLPIRIRTAGLGQALRFIYAKSKICDPNKDYRSRLLIALGKWLLEERKLFKKPNGANDCSALLLAIIENDANLLRQATEEALLYLQWLTRFCEATIKIDEVHESR